MRNALSLLSAAAAFVAWATSVFAAGQNAPSLKAETTVTSEIVRIGDIVDNAGALSDVAIFRAPDVGETGNVAVSRVIDALRPHGLDGVNDGGLTAIAVTRAGRMIMPSDIEQTITQAFAGRHGFGQADDLTLTFDRTLSGFGVDPTSGDLKIGRIYYDARSRRFDVSLEINAGSAPRQIRYTGTIVETLEVPVLTRAANKGDIIKSADVAMERKPKAEVAVGSIRQMDQIIGLAARAPLRAGYPLRNAELMKPELVRQNETVTLIFEMPGIVLSARGKASESGAVGDTVNVVNLQSKQTIQGVVSGLNRVTVVSNAPRIVAFDDSEQTNQSAKARAR